MIIMRIRELLFVFVYFIKIVCCNQNSADSKIFELTLDSVGDVKLFWEINYKTENIDFEIHFPNNFAKWFAFGFSNYGEYAPADYCVFWTDWKDQIQLEDTFVDKDGYLLRDTKQDCRNFELVIKNNVIYTFSREFSTCDDNDYIIEDGTTHIVWVSGNDKLYDINGLNILQSSNSKRGMVRSQLLKNINVNLNLEPGSSHMDFLTDKVHVPSVDTTYWCKTFQLPEYLEQKHHISRFEANIQKGNEGLVHHMELFQCVAPRDTIISNYEGPCFDSKRPNDTQVCKKVLAAWAMGATPFIYPEEAGLPVGGPNFASYVMLEVHYNNPEMISDWIDSSGLRITIAPKLRKYDAGIIELGLEYTDKMAIPPNQEKFYLKGYCITECTEVGLPRDGIIVFGSQLHTHLTGVEVYTKHIRNDFELPELNRDNHYSTHFQEIRRLKKPVNVLPGDALITACAYRTLDRQNITLGGFAITDEMCVNYIHYYPATKLEVCKSSINDQSLHTYFKIMKLYEFQNTSDLKGISDNYNSIIWTPLRAILLNEYYQKAPLAMQCNMSNGDRFPGYWESMRKSTIQIPLEPPINKCSASVEDWIVDRYY